MSPHVFIMYVEFLFRRTILYSDTQYGLEPKFKLFSKLTRIFAVHNCTRERHDCSWSIVDFNTSENSPPTGFQSALVVPYLFRESHQKKKVRTRLLAISQRFFARQSVNPH